MIIKIVLSPNFSEFSVPDIFNGTLEEAKSTNGRIILADYILNHHRERDVAIKGLEDVQQNWHDRNFTRAAGRYWYLDTLGNPQYTYYLDYKPDIDFSLCGQEIECDVAITLARNEHKYFDLTLDSGLCICGVEGSDYVDSSYRLTLSRVDRIDPYDSVEDIQEQARDLVDEMLDQLSKYELRK